MHSPRRGRSGRVALHPSCCSARSHGPPARRRSGRPVSGSLPWRRCAKPLPSVPVEPGSLPVLLRSRRISHRGLSSARARPGFCCRAGRETSSWARWPWATLAAVLSAAPAPVDAHLLSATPSGGLRERRARRTRVPLGRILFNLARHARARRGIAVLSIIRRQQGERERVDRSGGASLSRFATGLSRTGDYCLVYLGQLVTSA